MTLAAADVEEFVVESILNHRYNGFKKIKTNLEFLVRWESLGPTYDSWETYHTMRNVELLDNYAKDHPGLKLG
jgi:hypothetical protein